MYVYMCVVYVTVCALYKPHRSIAERKRCALRATDWCNIAIKLFHLSHFRQAVAIFYSTVKNNLFGIL